MLSIHSVSIMMRISISIGNSTENTTEPWILVQMHMANERCQQNSHKWQTSVDSWASSDIGEVLSLFYKSLDCFTMRLFHSATIFCCYICTCICCLKLHQADYQVGEVFFNSIWWGALSSNVFTICAVYWSLGRRGYFGVSNGVLVLA